MSSDPKTCAVFPLAPTDAVGEAQCDPETFQQSVKECLSREPVLILVAAMLAHLDIGRDIAKTPD